ncbi:MAG: cupin-like domain-containing protein [Bdellovibrionota bacterium]
MKPALLEISTLLNHSPMEYFRSLSGVTFSYGQEHSLFVNGFMEKTGQDAPPEAYAPMFRDEGRFVGEIDFKDYWKKPVAHSVAGKLVEKERLPSLSGLGKIKDLRCFVGKSGDSSSLHFDWNPFPNILFNLTGSKRITLYPPEASRALGGYANFSFNHDAEGSQTFILEAGEALVIPPWWWHRVEYLSEAASLSIRLDKIPDFIPSLEGLYPTWKMLLAQVHPGTDAERSLNHLIGHRPEDDHRFYLPWVRSFCFLNKGVMTS